MDFGHFLFAGSVLNPIGASHTEYVDLVWLVRVARVTIGHVLPAWATWNKFGFDLDLNGFTIDFDLSSGSDVDHVGCL